MMELHAEGRTIDDIVEVLKRVPILPNVVPAIKTAHALGYRIVGSLSVFVFTSLIELHWLRFLRSLFVLVFFQM